MRPRPPLRILAAIGLAAGTVLGAACSDDDAESEGDTTSTTVTTTVATSTTVSGRHPTLIASVHGLVGWWDGSTWFNAADATDTMTPPVAGGEVYALVSLEGPTTTSRGGTLLEREEFCSSPRIALDRGFPDYGPGEAPPIAVHGLQVDPMPRPVALLDAEAEVYRDAAAEVLDGLGIDEDDPRLAQVVRADLSGDGTDEVLVVAEQIADPTGPYAEPGDYAVLFLRQVIGGEVQTTVVAEHRNQSTAAEPSPYLVQPRVAAAVDLNGDGAMEVVVHQQYYEGSSTQVYAMGGGGLDQIMAASCGV